MHKLPVSDGATHQRCFLRDTQDALLILQSVLNNKLLLTQRRPTDQTRQDLIKSGNVFVVDIAKGPINRWTDGLSWSPSRILGAFLLYREKKQGKRGVKVGHVSKKSKSDMSPSSPNRSSQHKRGSTSSMDMMAPGMLMPPELGYPSFLLEHPNQHSNQHPLQLPNQMSNQMQGMPLHQQSDSMSSALLYSTSPRSPTSNSQSDEYTLYGSLTSNEQYKVNGLLKKTITIGFRESVYRIVGYYLPKDVEERRLLTPSQDGFFRDIKIDPELSDSKNIKMPVAMNERDYEQLDPIYGLPLGPNSSMRSFFPLNPDPMSSGFPPNMTYNPSKQMAVPLSDNAFDESNNGRDELAYNKGVPGQFDNLMPSSNLYEVQQHQRLNNAGNASAYSQTFDNPRSGMTMGDVRGMQDNQMRGSRYVESRYPQISPELANRSWNLNQEQFVGNELNRQSATSGVFQDPFEKDFKYSSGGFSVMAPESHFTLDDPLHMGISKESTMMVKQEPMTPSLENSPYSKGSLNDKSVSTPSSQGIKLDMYTPVSSTGAVNPLNTSIDGSDSYPVSMTSQDHRDLNPLFTNESPSGSSLLSDLSAELHHDEFINDRSKKDESTEAQKQVSQKQQKQQQQGQQQHQQQDQQSYLSTTSGLFDERQF